MDYSVSKIVMVEYNNIEKDIQKIITNSEKVNIFFYSYADKKYPKKFLKINNTSFIFKVPFFHS